MRQGDPLSPYLFIMVVDLLGRLSTKAEVVGLIEGFSVIEGSLTVPLFNLRMTHSLCLKRIWRGGLRNLMCILLMVEAATGLRINWSKTTSSLVGYVLEVENMMNVIGCEVLPLPISYLGLLLGAKSSFKSIWNLVLKKKGSKLTH